MAVSTTNTKLDTKVASVSTLLETLRNDVTSILQSLHSDVSTKFDDVYITVDRTLTSACSEWRSDIDSSLTSLRSEWHSTIEDTNHHFATCLKDTSLHFDTRVTELTDNISTLENLSVSDPQVLCLLNEATLEHIRNLLLSPAIDEVITRFVSREISSLTQEVQAMKNLSSSFPMLRPNKKTLVSPSSQKI